MLHHRKVNKNIIIILLVCYFLPFLLNLIGNFIIGIQFLIAIAMLVSFIAPLIFGVYFYRKYANQGMPSSEIIEPINSM